MRRSKLLGILRTAEGLVHLRGARSKRPSGPLGGQIFWGKAGVQKTSM